MVKSARSGLLPNVPRLLAVAALNGACAASSPSVPAFDVLHQPPPRAPHAIGSHALEAADYARFVAWGADWFRGETLGNERSMTDVLGFMNGVVEVPCDGDGGSSGCFRDAGVFRFFLAALDALDGREGNLFEGNGGGFTSDLVLRFPQGTRLYGEIPVPEALHTGLDVEAGEPWPIGVVAFEAPEGDQALTYLPLPSELTRDGPARRTRLGLTCAVCHYSLDIDGDGRADLTSARLGHPTPQSPYRPEHAWAIGNQDLHFGWLLALSANPLLAFPLLSGPIGSTRPSDAVAFTRWILDNYVQSPQAVAREVTRSMLLQPRGSADDVPNASHEAVQIPTILTQQNWPYNSVGAFQASDLTSVVWTTSLDFTGLIALAGDRANAVSAALFWEAPSIFSLLPAATYADVMTRLSPAVRFQPALQPPLVADILGIADGVPGLLDPDSLLVFESPSGALPKDVYDHPANAGRRLALTRDRYGSDALERTGTVAEFGLRMRTPPALRRAINLGAITAQYHVNPDEFLNDAVSLMLDGQEPVPNHSPLLAGQWALVERGYRIFREQGCDRCHGGAFLTDNRVHRLSTSEAEQFGISPPTTAGWVLPGRDLGPALGTDPLRALGTRAEESFIAPQYDPKTGRVATAGGIGAGLFGERPIGYKTATLRNIWATPPYLHDGSVGVGFAGDAPRVGSLRERLIEARGEESLRYGMGPLMDAFEQGQFGATPVHWQRPDAALSLQALLLASERRKIIASNAALTLHVPRSRTLPSNEASAPERVSVRTLGVSGIGHEYWLDDEPGGERITALVAFLLALDDKPCELPGEPSHCAPSTPEKP